VNTITQMIECKEQYNASAIKYRIRMQSTGNQGTISTKVARSIMQKRASSNSKFLSKLLQHIQSTICEDIHALQVQKWTFRTQAMQNTANDYLTATQTQKNWLVIIVYRPSCQSWYVLRVLQNVLQNAGREFKIGG
jgi:hypothetical protein